MEGRSLEETCLCLLFSTPCWEISSPAHIFSLLLPPPWSIWASTAWRHCSAGAGCSVSLYHRRGQREEERGRKQEETEHYPSFYSLHLGRTPPCLVPHG